MCYLSNFCHLERPRDNVLHHPAIVIEEVTGELKRGVDKDKGDKVE